MLMTSDTQVQFKTRTYPQKIHLTDSLQDAAYQPIGLNDRIPLIEFHLHWLKKLLPYRTDAIEPWILFFHFPIKWLFQRLTKR